MERTVNAGRALLETFRPAFSHFFFRFTPDFGCSRLSLYGTIKTRYV